jgi:hypothetical protein
LCLLEDFVTNASLLSLTNLEELRLSPGHRGNIPKDLPKLTSFHFPFATQKDLPPHEHLKSLTAFELDRDLSGFVNLTDINLRYWDNGDFVFPFPDNLKSLRIQEGLETIDLRFYTNLTCLELPPEIPQATGLELLTNLQKYFCTSCTNYATLSNFTNLTKIALHPYRAFPSLPGISFSGITNLVSLDLSRHAVVPPFFLGNLTSLKNLSSQTAIPNFFELTKLRKLSGHEISYPIMGISALTGLTFLEISGLSINQWHPAWSILTNLVSLSTWEIDDGILKNLTKLRNLQVWVCPEHVAADLPCLTRLVMNALKIGNRKFLGFGARTVEITWRREIACIM